MHNLPVSSMQFAFARKNVMYLKIYRSLPIDCINAIIGEYNYSNAWLFIVVLLNIEFGRGGGGLD